MIQQYHVCDFHQRCYISLYLLYPRTIHFNHPPGRLHVRLPTWISVLVNVHDDLPEVVNDGVKQSEAIFTRVHHLTYLNKDLYHPGERVSVTRTHLQHYNGNLYHSPRRMGAHDANTPTTLQWEPVLFTHENGCP